MSRASEITVSKDIVRFRKLAQKVSDAELINLCQRAKSAVHELADLLTRSYAVRVVADYNLEIPIDFSAADRFRLNGIEITEAHQWPEKAKTFCCSVSDLWKQMDE